jgi:hypothetical protein
MMKMDRIQPGRKVKTLWVLVLLGIAYSSFLWFQLTPIGTGQVGGIIAVLLGLYICSHPAANLVDMLFFSKAPDIGSHLSSRQSRVLWLALNMLVLLVGWIVIFAGTTRLVGRAD